MKIKFYIYFVIIVTIPILGLSSKIQLFLSAVLILFGLLNIEKKHKELANITWVYLTIKLIKTPVLLSLIIHSDLATQTRRSIAHIHEFSYDILVILEQVILITSAYFYLTQKQSRIPIAVIYITLFQLLLSRWIEINNILLVNSFIGISLYLMYQYDRFKHKFFNINFKHEVLFLSFFLFFIQYFFEMLFLKLDLIYDVSFSYIIIGFISYLVLISSQKKLLYFFDDLRSLAALQILILILLFFESNTTHRIMYVALSASYICIGFFIYKIKFKLR